MITDDIKNLWRNLTRIKPNYTHNFLDIQLKDRKLKESKESYLYTLIRKDRPLLISSSNFPISQVTPARFQQFRRYHIPSVYLFPPTGIPFPLAIPLFPALSSFRTVPPLSIPFPSFSIPVGRATVCCNSPAVSSYASLHARERQNIGHISLSSFSHITIREWTSDLFISTSWIILKQGKRFSYLFSSASKIAFAIFLCSRNFKD